MKARTLKSVRICVEGTLPVQLCDPRTRALNGALHSRHGKVRPKLASVTNSEGKEEAWLLVTGSNFGGLPLSGGPRSWQLAWEDAQIEFYLSSAKGWEPIEEWKELMDVVRKKM